MRAKRSRATEEILRNRELARYHLGAALRKGELPAANTLTCVECGEPAREYHHHKGYAREDWLNVIPMCVVCHRRANFRQRPQCQAISESTGERCRIRAIAGTNRCHHHSPKEAAINPLRIERDVPKGQPIPFVRYDPGPGQ